MMENRPLTDKTASVNTSQVMTRAIADYFIFFFR